MWLRRWAEKSFKILLGTSIRGILLMVDSSIRLKKLSLTLLHDHFVALKGLFLECFDFFVLQMFRVLVNLMREQVWGADLWTSLAETVSAEDRVVRSHMGCVLLSDLGKAGLLLDISALAEFEGSWLWFDNCFEHLQVMDEGAHSVVKRVNVDFVARWCGTPLVCFGGSRVTRRVRERML